MQRSHFSLQGTSISLDERVHAVRGDLADLALAGQIFVPHYARAKAMQCTAIHTPVLDAGNPQAKMTTELLLGEEFLALEINGDWVWGYCRHDHYVGYVALSALSEAVTDAPHVVTVRSAALRNSPDDSGVSGTLPMGCRVTGDLDGDFLRTSHGYIARDALDGSFDDPVAVAEQLIDTPYVWGGRSSEGIDCSGLVQLSCALASGVAAPRDSDQQQFQLGSEIPEANALRRNDVIYFPGHVGMMANETDLIHATRYHDKVVVEPLETVIERVKKKHETDRPVLARRRLG